jgi:hypothetical protein
MNLTNERNIVAIATEIGKIAIAVSWNNGIQKGDRDKHKFRLFSEPQ